MTLPSQRPETSEDRPIQLTDEVEDSDVAPISVGYFFYVRILFEQSASSALIFLPSPNSLIFLQTLDTCFMLRSPATPTNSTLCPSPFPSFVKFSVDWSATDSWCMAELQAGTIVVLSVLLTSAIALLGLIAWKTYFLVKLARARAQLRAEQEKVFHTSEVIDESSSTSFWLVGMLATTCLFLIAFSCALLANTSISTDKLIVYFFTLFLPAQQLNVIAATIFSGWLLLFLSSVLRNLASVHRTRIMWAHWALSSVVLLFSTGISMLVFWRESIADRTFLILIGVGICLDEVLYLSIAIKLVYVLSQFARKFYKCGDPMPLSAFAKAMIGLWVWNACLAVFIFLLSVSYLLLATMSGLTAGMLVTVVTAIPFQWVFVFVCLSSISDRIGPTQSVSALSFPLSVLACQPACCNGSSHHSHSFFADYSDQEDNPLVNPEKEHPAHSLNTPVLSHVTTQEW